jgi:hypothetical protein
MDHNGTPVAFFIDKNGVLERSVNNGPAVQVDGWGCHCDKQVSAGTDAYGNAVAYVLNGYGSLWEIGWNWNGLLYETHIGDNVTSFSAVMYGSGLKGVYGGTQGGVYFIGNGWDMLYNNFNFQILSSGQYDQQISAGTDSSGYSVTYVLNKINRDVYQRNAYGGWSVDLTNCGCTTQVVGGVQGLWYTNDDAQDVFVHNGTGHWSYRFLQSHVTQISAGTDFYGNSTVDMMVTSYNGGYFAQQNLYQFDSGNGWFSNPYLLATNVREAAAGFGGNDYYADSSSQLHAQDWWWNDWIIGSNVQ